MSCKDKETMHLTASSKTTAAIICAGTGRVVQVGLAEVQLVSLPAGILAVSDQAVLLRSDPEYKASSAEATDQQSGMPALMPQASPVHLSASGARNNNTNALSVTRFMRRSAQNHQRTTGACKRSSNSSCRSRLCGNAQHACLVGR
jgi:hypothetical protein